MSVEADYRLPRSVIPSRYELTLSPDLATGAFTGTESVVVEVVAPVRDVTLNAVDLTIGNVSVTDSNGHTLVAESVSYDGSRERATLHFGVDLAPGSWTLRTDFDGVLNDHLHGFYRSTYKDDDGVEQTIATTQFEATDARRAFPCWDEPDMKATYVVTLVVADGLVAISNAAEVDTEILADGRVAHRFAETMRMSTYLVAFVVGNLEVSGPVDAGGIPLRVLHTPGKAGLADLALEMGAFALDYLSSYYDIPYPGDKLDMIAVPDFAWGAMENLGAVTYRETALLVDRATATQEEMARVADVIAHELAHMWFGNLVTMKWWNGIWLNEAFATFMELKCVDAYRPDWKRWLSYAPFRAHSMDVDGLSATRTVEYRVASPAEANAMFDTLTYGKGSAVLRMLEQYLGEDTFRRGISRYLKKHAYGNTETDDLWAALEAESGEPVGEIMNGWIYQGGYPQLEVSKANGGYRVRHGPFRYLGEGAGRWKVPVLFQAGKTAGRLLLEDDEFIAADGDFFLLNKGGAGFYRTNYPEDHLRALAERFDSLAPGERFTILADAWANVLAGESATEAFLELIDALGKESEPDVWGLAIGGLAELGRVIEPTDRPLLQQRVRDYVAASVARLGWVPESGETDLDRKLRGLMLRTVAILGDDATAQDKAREVFETVLADRGAVDADVADAVTSIVAANGGSEEFDRLLALRADAANPQDEVRYLRAATAVPEETTAARMIDMVLSGEIRSQDSNWVVARLLGHRDTGVSVWALVKENWDRVLEAMPPQNQRRMLDLIIYRSEPDVAADIEAWLQEHPLRGQRSFWSY